MAAIDYGTGPNTTTGDPIPSALAKLKARLLAAGFDPGIESASNVASAIRLIEMATEAAETAYVPPLPGPMPTLTISGALSFAANAPAGTVIASIGNVPAGQVPTVTPNDGRLAIAGNALAGWAIVVGNSASTAGTIAVSVTATGANGASATITVTPAIVALTISGSPGAGTVGTSPSFAPTISGGTAPYTLSLLSGTLPPGRTVNGSARTVTGTYTTAGTYSYVLRATDSANPALTADLTVNLTVQAAAVPLDDAFVYLIGASLEGNAGRGQSSPTFGYGYSPQGPAAWLFWLSGIRPYFFDMGRGYPDYPFHSRVSLLATNGSDYTTGRANGYSINEQVDRAIAHMRTLPAGKKVIVYYSGGRNGMTVASTWLSREFANIDKLLAERTDLLINPGLWKRHSSAGSGWQIGGSNRGYVDQINAQMPALVAQRDSRLVYIPTQNLMSDGTADQNPKAAYVVDIDTHYSSIGGQVIGTAEYNAVKSRLGAAPALGGNLIGSGTGGTVSNGATGTLPDGYTGTKDPTVGVAFSTSNGSATMAITRAATQATVAEGATITGPAQAVPAGGKYRMATRIDIAPTPLPVSVSAYLEETTPGSVQRAYAIWSMRTGDEGLLASATASGNLDALDASAGLTLYVETPDLDVAANSAASIRPVVTASVNQGEPATFNVTTSQFRIAKLADAVPTVGFVNAAINKPEGNSGANVFAFQVTRSTGTGAVDVPYAFAAGGTDAADYTGGVLPTSGTVSFAAGETSKFINISANGDTMEEASETFTLTLTVPSGYQSAGNLMASGTIGNDDGAQVFAFRDNWTEAADASITAHTSNSGHTWTQIGSYGGTVIGGQNYARFDRGTAYLRNSYAPASGNYDLKVPIRFKTARAAGIAIRMAADAGCVTVGYSANSAAWAANDRTSGNSITGYYATPVTIVLNQWYMMEIRVRGNTFEQYIDGVLVSPAAVAFKTNFGTNIGLANITSYSTNGTSGCEFGEMTVTELAA